MGAGEGGGDEDWGGRGEEAEEVAEGEAGAECEEGEGEDGAGGGGGGGVDGNQEMWTLNLRVERVEFCCSCQDELNAVDEAWLLKLGLAYL